jgi:hypothetical protein
LIRALFEYYGILEDLVGTFRADVSDGSGFFHLGPDILCYGSCSAGVASNAEDARSYDSLDHIALDRSELRLPFDPDQVIENMRRERYAASMTSWRESLFSSKRARSAYYIARDLLPDCFRRQLQRAYFGGWDRKGFPHWPVDFSVDNIHQTFLRLWKALPGEVDRWWRARTQMRLVFRGSDWEIPGPQKERAQVAFAVLDGQQLKYEIAGSSVAREEPS